MAAIAALATVAAARAELRLGAPFTDGAVLQRGRAVPVWGTAAAGERVDVSFGRQTVSATAGEDGRWRVDLVPMAASASGRTLAAVSASGKAEAKDVLVGEVWLAGGQSNMEFPLCGTNPRLFDREGAAMAQAALRPELRFAMIGKRWSVTPQPDVQVDWRNCTPSNVCAGVSAIAFWYGLVLHDALRVPVGVVCAAWGGTCIEPWIPPQGYAKYPELDKWGKWPVTAEWKDEMKDTSVCAAHQQPSVLWNGMWAGLSPYAVKGLIWYQGEHNARPGWAVKYDVKMHALLDGFADAFETPGLSFYYVLLAPFRHMDFSEVQRFQLRFRDPRAAMAVIHDVGQVDEIHPHDKRTPAFRLALHALKRDYGYDLQDCSPTFAGWKREGRAARLSFDNAKSLYVYNPDRAMSADFELLGTDGVWRKAKFANLLVSVDGRGRKMVSGRFEGAGILLVADGVDDPQGVRYLHNPPFFGCVYNEVNLPLAPFDSILD